MFVDEAAFTKANIVEVLNRIYPDKSMFASREEHRDVITAHLDQLLHALDEFLAL